MPVLHSPLRPRSSDARAPGACLAACLVTLLIAACGGTPGAADPAPVSVEPPPVAALGHQLNASRPAGPATTVVLKVAAGAPAGEIRVPYRFDAGQLLRHCIPDDDLRMIAARLDTATGESAWSHRRGEPCPDATEVPAGDYVLTVAHEAAPDGFLIFVHAPGTDAEAARPLAAVPGAIPDTDADGGEFLFLRIGGRTVFTDGPSYARPDAGAFVPRTAPLDRWAMFSLTTLRLDGVEHQLILPRDRRPGASSEFRLCPASGQPADFALRRTCARLPADDPAPRVLRGAAMRAAGGRDATYCYGIGDAAATDGGLVRTWCLAAAADGSLATLRTGSFDAAAAVFTLNPRYRSDASGHRPARGEALVFTDRIVPADGPDAALVFAGDATVDVPGLTAFRVRTGPDTSVSFDGGPWMSGEYSLGGFRSPVTSVRVRESREVLIATGSCQGCDLSGLDLSDLDLAGVDLRAARLAGAKADRTSFRGARLPYTDFTGASLVDARFDAAFAPDGTPRHTLLDGTVFDGADLRGAIFTGEALGCVSMRGARLDEARFAGTAMQCVDLGDANLTTAWFLSSLRLPGLERATMEAPTARQCAPGTRRVGDLPDPATGLYAGVPCKGLRLAGSQVWTDSPPLASWKHSDMSGAVIRGRAGEPVAQATLSGADLRGGRFAAVRFDGATLRNAKFDGADLTRASFVGADLGCPTGAAAPCTSFARAILRGADLSFAVATGADFTEAVLGEKPAPQGVAGGAPEIPAATMTYLFAPRSDFTAADLTGVDLSNAQLYGPGTRFSRASAVRTAFRGATLSSVDFTESRLQGADFTDANLLLAAFPVAQFGAASDGSRTRFVGAMLQGAKLAGVDASDTTFRGATFAQRQGSITVRHEQRPGVFYDRTVAFCATTVPTATASTLCPGTANGACGDWSTPAPRQPTCVPTPDDPCPATYRASAAVPFVDLGPTGLACTP